MPKEKSLEETLQDEFTSLLKDINKLPDGEDKIAKKTTALSAASKFLQIKNKLKPEGDDEPSFATRAGKLIHDSHGDDSGRTGRELPIGTIFGDGQLTSVNIKGTPGYGLLPDDTQDT